MNKILSLTIIIFYTIVFFQQFTFQNVIKDIRTHEEQIKELNSYIDDLIHYIQTIPDTVLVETIKLETEYIVRVDTVEVIREVGYNNIEPILTYTFDVTDKEEDMFFNATGDIILEWDTNSQKYKITDSYISSKTLNLNLSTDYSVQGSIMRMGVDSRSSNVNISYLSNDVIDLSKVHVAETSRWGTGVVGGVGLVNTGFTPFIGMGVFYKFSDLNFKK